MAALCNLSVCCFILITIFTDATSKENSNKESLIKEIAKKMEIIATTSLRANRFYSLKPSRVIEYLRKRVWKSASGRANSKLYVDIIMKGFEILIPEQENITKYVRSNQIVPVKYNVSQIRNEKSKGNLKYKHGPKLDIIEDIMMKLKKFSESYKISIDDAFDIIKYKLNEAADEELNNIISAVKVITTTSVYNEPVINDFSREQNYIHTNHKEHGIESLTSACINRSRTTRNDNCLPKKCVCEGNISKSMECSRLCLSVCEHIYNIDRWICASINGSNSIPVNLLCDGFLDCLDQSDELNCNYRSDKSKYFEANKMINDLILTTEPLTKNSQMKEYIFLKSTLKSLHQRIVHLLNTNHIASEGDIQLVILRNDVFNEISSIYRFLSKDYTDIKDIENIYKDFTIFKNTVLKALKLCITGNRRLIPEGKCFCREGICGVAQCSKDCETICTTLPMFTRYHCTNTRNKDTYVPLKSLCDGKFDCPKKDDEINCVKEPCRTHHLIMLKHKLLALHQKYKGTRVKEIIRSWLALVIKKLEKEESSDKEKGSILKDLTMEALANLTQDYKNSDKSLRVDNNPIDHFPTFYQAAEILVETKKTCDIW